MVLIAGLGLAVVNLSSMADCESEDDEFIVLDVADKAIVADAITPLAFSIFDGDFTHRIRLSDASKVLNR